MSQTDKWDRGYSQKECATETACEVLSQNIHLLPLSGRALDVASGLGANAVLLAQNNLYVEAWDISSVAIDKINKFSELHRLKIKSTVRDIEKHPPAKNTFNVICVSNFLHRASFGCLIDSLEPGGLLYYQTFIVDKTIDVGPSNPDYLLMKNELLEFCRGMDVLVYREEGTQGNINNGWRNQAMIVARKN